MIVETPALNAEPVRLWIVHRSLLLVVAGIVCTSKNALMSIVILSAISDTFPILHILFVCERFNILQ